MRTENNIHGFDLAMQVTALIFTQLNARLGLTRNLRVSMLGLTLVKEQSYILTSDETAAQHY